MKKLFFLIILLLFAGIPSGTYAADSYVSIVNPVRGGDFWESADQKPETAVFNQQEILKQLKLTATWLIRFDALSDKNIVDKLNENPSDEKGLFLEVTPSWTQQASVQYQKSPSWHEAGSAFLTGYVPSDREKLIDVSFQKFKDIFGYYPSSVGAWWIDSHSLSYMKIKYGVSAALIVSDQYSTDNYQIWGQYFSTPYYPSKNNALQPAQKTENKLDILITQWAPRDPVNSYGNGVMDSTFSVQANDYTDYHSLDTNYFSKLVDIYTNQRFNAFNHLVVGLENSYEWNKYSKEYLKQIEILADKKNLKELSVVNMRDFAAWYKKAFPGLSPTQIIISDDPLGSFKKSVWFMNPYYRAAWFFNEEGSVFRDIRQYIDGTEELCLKVRCDSVNFATSATRVLDEVSFGHKWIVDKGKVSGFNARKEGNNLILSYTNEGGNKREIILLQRDISIDGETFSIDTAILNATKEGNVSAKASVFSAGTLNWSPYSVVAKLAKFLLFLIIAILIPGHLLSRKLTIGKSLLLSLFMAGAVGMVALTLVYYLTSLLAVKFLIFVYLFFCLVLNIFNYYGNTGKFNLTFLKNIMDLMKSKLNLFLITVIFSGTLFQVIPTFKSGLNFTYGTGFWGPNTHDGIWHIALINQLARSIPPENPVFSGESLKNYHFFYDLLIAATNSISGLPVADLLFRFYPVIFSLMLGIGSYFLFMKLFEDKIGSMKAKLGCLFSLYLIYFSGSLGWIVEFLRERHLGGESAFWVNQSVSFNLNPPYAISLIITIAITLILLSPKIKTAAWLPLIIMVGLLASFKSYTGILVITALFSVAIIRFFRRKDLSLLFGTGCSLVLFTWLFLSNFQADRELLVFAPFWFIHSMVDSPDRVGWVKLSLARTSSLVLGQWPKFILAETVSLVLFIIGNLGVRILSFGLIFKLKEVLKNDGLLFIFIIFIGSLGIPILFIQSGNPWNAIQFFYPSLYLSSLFAGAVVSYLVFKLPKALIALFLLVILVVAPINSFVTASGYLSDNPHAFISSKELDALEFLSKQPQGRVLIYPYDEKLKQKIAEPWPLMAYDSTAYVGAYSKKAVYLEDESQNQILLTDYKKRLVASRDFFLRGVAQETKLLQANNIKYIYLPKIYKLSLDESSGIIENIYENDEVLVFRINQ